MLHNFLHRIVEKGKDNSSAPVLICALGDSVTQGCMEVNVFDFKHVYHNVLKGLLETRFPKTTFSVINAGVGGESAAEGLKRLERDVIRHDPDLTLVAFGLNDATRDPDNLDRYRCDIQEIFQRIRAGCKSDLLAVTPGFMARHTSRKIAKEHRRYTKTIIQTQNKKILKSYVEALKETACAANVPVADVHAQWEKMAKKGKDTDALLVNGLNHPDRFGHALAARTIFKTILGSSNTSDK